VIAAILQLYHDDEMMISVLYTY